MERDDRDSTLRDGGRGRFRAALRRVFGEGENPLDWALPLYTAWGIRVRIHVVYVVMIVAWLLQSLRHDAIGFWPMLTAMVSMFGLVLLHEYGHCIACRRVGGTADQILMWPLGGLAWCDPPHHWRAHLITVIGGPAVNVALLPLLALMLFLVAGISALWFNPLSLGTSLARLTHAGPLAPLLEVVGITGQTSPLLRALWWLYVMNWFLLLFNVLLPMYPMDGGRIVHALLWRRIGEREATGFIVRLGIGIAIVLFVVAAVIGDTLLMAIAAFGGFTCYLERTRWKAMSSDGALSSYDFERGYTGMPEEAEPPVSRADRRRAERAAREAQEEDRVLAKISCMGIDSLTRAERRVLDRATRRRRGST